MAERRMFAKTIIDSDVFLEMPQSSQLLYFHLSMRADDEGFVNKPKTIMRMVGAKDDDMKVLIAKKFLIAFESGVIVIKHWKIHNYIRGDRLQNTKYQEEKELLTIDENNSYKLLCQSNVSQVLGNCHTEVRLGKDRIELGKDKDKALKPQKHKYGEYQNVLLNEEELQKLQDEFPDDWTARIERVSEYCASTGKIYKNYLATIRNWAKKEKPKNQTSNPFLKMMQEELEKEANQ